MAKRKRKARVEVPKITVAPCPWDMGASGPANQIGLVVEDAPTVDLDTGKIHNPNGVRRSRRPDHVERYAKSGLISQSEYAAAISLRALAEGRAGQDPLAALRVDVVGPSGLSPEEANFDARRRFHSVWDEIPQECRDVVGKAVIMDECLDVAFGGKMYENLEAYAKLRVGLQAISEAGE